MRRKMSEEESSSNEERWLLTYSDMITLLLALFILLYSMSTVDLAKYKAVAEGMGAAFKNPAIQGEGSGNPQNPSTTGDKAGEKTDELDMTELQAQLNQFVQNAGLQDQIEITGSGDFVQINLKDSVLFIPDSPNMVPGGEPILVGIENLLVAAYNQIGHITIRGHTAYVDGQDSPQNEQFGWTLSSARALNVLNVFTKNGLPPNKFSIEGCSHYSPIASNDSEEGRAKNRRVEIYVTK